MIHENVPVLWNRPVNLSYHKIGLKTGPAFAEIVPGQFVMLRLPEHMGTFLRRPFSIHGILRNEEAYEGIEILYNVVGEGTRNLSRCRPDDRVGIIGPLGNGFSIPEAARCIYLAAGGIGIAPIRFLVSSLVRRCGDRCDISVFLGGRTREDLLCRDEVFALGVTVHMTTDDGSEGEKGLVTDALKRALAVKRPDIVCACGPHGMLKQVAKTAKHASVPCQVSLESHMACGIGACLGCAVESIHGSGFYQHVCKDGPVFDAEALMW